MVQEFPDFFRIKCSVVSPFLRRFFPSQMRLIYVDTSVVQKTLIDHLLNLNPYPLADQDYFREIAANHNLNQGLRNGQSHCFYMVAKYKDL
jgi:hypothetical protein